MHDFEVNGIKFTHEDIKPCPFCGEKAELKWKRVGTNKPWFDDSYFFIECVNKNCMAKSYEHHIGSPPEYAIYESLVAINTLVFVWNKRTNEKGD